MSAPAILPEPASGVVPKPGLDSEPGVVLQSRVVSKSGTEPGPEPASGVAPKPAPHAAPRSAWARTLALALIVASVLSSLSALVLADPCLADENDAAAVEQWLAASAGPYLRSHAAESLPTLAPSEIGAPVEAYGYAGGGLKASGYWAAPLRLRGTFVGTIALLHAKPDVAAVSVSDSQGFATTLAEIPAGARLLVEPSLGKSKDIGGFFLISADQMVTPLDPVARSYVAGSLPVSSFLAIVSDLATANTPTATATPGPAMAGANPVRWVAGALVALAVVLAATVWYRRDLMDSGGNASGADSGSGRAEGDGHRHVMRERGEVSRVVRRGAQRIRVVDKPVRKAASRDGSGRTGGEPAGAGNVARTPIGERPGGVSVPGDEFSGKGFS